MRLAKQQQGFLMIVLAVLIVIFALLAKSLIHVFINTTIGHTQRLSSTQAFYIAEGGLAHAKYLLTPTAGVSRLSCADIVAGAPSLTDINLGQGQYRVTADHYLSEPASALTGSITAVVTTIAVTSTALYAPGGGRIRIDNEEMSYTGLSGNSFTGVTRGIDGTLASSHSAAVQVEQNQCVLTAVGGVPNLVAATGMRQVSTSDIQFQMVWTVGDKGETWQWNFPSANTWNTSTNNTTKLNGVAVYSFFDAWAVGKRDGGNFTIRRWDPNPIPPQWVSAPILPFVSGYEKELKAVAIVSAVDAWAVGKKKGKGGNAEYTILHWDGASWCLLGAGGPGGCGSIPSGDATDLNGVSVINTAGDAGFAVGKDGKILKLNGNTWSVDESNTSEDLFAVTRFSNEAWAVGYRGTILRWNGSTWALQTSPTDKKLKAMSMLDTTGNGVPDIGVAVGDSGTAIFYDGSTWSSNNISAGTGNYRGVVMLSANDIWAVGSGGLRAHWNGIVWTLVASGGEHLNAVASFHPSIPTIASAGWREIYQ